MALGKQVAVDFYDCDEGLLNNSSFLEETLKRAANEAGATVIQSVFHTFSPHGVSGVTVIAESHLCIHTWPEYQYAAVDIFTCSKEMDNYKALLLIKDALKARFYSVVELKRGIFPGMTEGGEQGERE
jgi:S-adenosylmethionine decarboxylase proenzyme